MLQVESLETAPPLVIRSVPTLTKIPTALLNHQMEPAAIDVAIPLEPVLAFENFAREDFRPSLINNEHCTRQCTGEGNRIHRQVKVDGYALSEADSMGLIVWAMGRIENQLPLVIRPFVLIVPLPVTLEEGEPRNSGDKRDATTLISQSQDVPISN